MFVELSEGLFSVDCGRGRALVAFAGFGLFWGTWGASVPAIEAHSGTGNGVMGVTLAFIGVSAFVSTRAAGFVLDRIACWGLPVAVSALAASALFPPLARFP